MLTDTKAGTNAKPSRHSIRGQRSGRNPRRERRLWHEPERATSSLGCATCPDFQLCGGLRLVAPFFDCLQFCCGNHQGCDRVCRNHPDYADRVREVGTFDFSTVPRAPVVVAPNLPRVVPIIYHRTSRRQPPPLETVALPLYSLFDRRSGLSRYASHNALCEAFAIRSGSTILLTGIDKDPPLERWWDFGEEVRCSIIRSMKDVGIGLVTTPNYSLFIDRPRWDDLHAMKRIAIIHEEFLRMGLPAALHVNGRTEWDFQRWAAYLRCRPEVTHIAYEFTTGTRSRREQHARWLAWLAAEAGRPVHLVVRGGLEVLPVLARAFPKITVLDTSIFMKSMKRRRAYPKRNAEIGWAGSATERGASVDELFTSNCIMVSSWLNDLIASAKGARILR